MDPKANVFPWTNSQFQQSPSSELNSENFRNNVNQNNYEFNPPVKNNN